MEDIFQKVKDGNALHVRLWLDNTENDLNQGDDHRFSLLHWASMMGHLNIVDMLLFRGARVNATNDGDDTALHLAAAHGHRDIVLLLMGNKANLGATNEHGNIPLHYACFWGYDDIAEDLVLSGSPICQENKYGQTPLELAKPHLSERIRDKAISSDKSLARIPFADKTWLGSKTRSRDATLSRNAGIDLKQLSFDYKIVTTHSGTSYHGNWQGNDIVAKALNLRHITQRMLRDFQHEYTRLRIFNHPNVLPVLGITASQPNLIVISQFMHYGSLFNVLHGETGIVVDQAQALRFAHDVARGMEFLHMLEPLIPNLALNSKHVMVDEDLAKIGDPEYTAHSHTGGSHAMIEEDLTARINMADYKFSFHEKGKVYNPAWMSPEALKRPAADINIRSADMWSFSILLWELATREVPFADVSPMECGMKIATEGLRIKVPPGISQHIARLIKICMNEDPGKRPRFDMIIPILDKMMASS